MASRYQNQLKENGFTPKRECVPYPDQKTKVHQSSDERNLRMALAPLLCGSWVVIGLGNTDRADDGTGLLVARIVQSIFPDRAFMETDTPVESIFDLLPKGCDTVLFVDAADFNGRPGEIRLFQSDHLDEFQPAVSTHQIPMAFWFSYAASKGLRPVLIGVQPADLTWMGGMNAAVQSASNTLGLMISEFA
jgi:hydrogenase maturation protease